MNDKQLADAVVALGVGNAYDVDCYTARLNGAFLDPENFVRDWRVAGALMEKCKGIHMMCWWQRMIFDGIDPRAIIEACVEALNES